MDTNLILRVIIIIAVVIFFVQKNKNQKIEDNETEEINNITEEDVFEAQNKFEKRLEEIYLPDAIVGKEVYIYKELMAIRYSELSSKNRYNNEIIQKIRNDWLDYMKALEDKSTYRFLYFEAENPQKANSHNKNFINASKKIIAIEDGFASAIGEKAKKNLEKIRELEQDKFNDKGEKAPIGYIYQMVGRGKFKTIKQK